MPDIRAKKQPKPMSEAVQNVLARTQHEFDPKIVDLGNKLSNKYSRHDISEAINGDRDVFDTMVYESWRNGWIKKDGEPDIVLALQWIKLVRSVSH